MLTVACVLRSGGIYDAAWVARLRAAVGRHLSQAHRFVCLSDVDVSGERIALEHDWPGWWSKIELFKLPGPVLFFDLDTAIVGDLSDIAAQAGEWRFTLLRDFYRQRGLGSGVMAWNCDMLRVYEKFAGMPDYWIKEIAGRGDQGFIEAVVNFDGIDRWQDVLPGQIVSYKRHCMGGQSPESGQWCAPGIPANARVVCLHGLPKFSDMPASDAVRQAWEMAA
jgi:hypothetical protein